MLRPTTSASNVHRRALCPGSEALEHGLADEDSAQSKEGTLLHYYDANSSLERAVLSPNQQDLLRNAAQADEFIFERVAKQYGLTADEPFEEVRDNQEKSELVALRGTEYETPGHTDRLRYYPHIKLLLIRDAKFGYKEVTPAAANYQLRTYAIGGAEQWDVDNVVVAITQPRLSFYQRVTMASYSRDDIELSRAELIGIRAESRKPGAALVAGEEQCRYCKAKTKCPQFTKQLVPLDGGKGIVNTLDALTPAQRDGLITAIKFANYIADSVLDHERKVIEYGGESLYMLGKAQDTREVTDTRKAVALLSLRGDLTREEALDCCSMHFGAIEEKVRKKNGGTWKDTKERVNATLDSVTLWGSKRAPLTRKKEEKRLK